MLSTVWAKVAKLGALIAGILFVLFAVKRTGKLEQKLEDTKVANDAEKERAQAETSATLETISASKTVREAINASSSAAVDSELRNKWSD